MARISAALGIGFVLIVGGLWVTRQPAPVPAPARPAADPFAARRPTPAIEGVAPSGAALPAERPFLEPSGAGVIAYGAGDLATSLEQFRTAVEQNPQDAESWSNLGQVLVKMNRTAEALPAFDRAIALLPGRWAYRFNQARALGLVGRLEESIAAYRVSQQLFPADYATTFNLALALHKKGDDEAAIEQYQKAIALNPGDASFRIALALSYERLKKPAEAAEAYGEALRLAPSAPDADSVRARIAQLTGQPAATSGRGA